MRHSLLLALLLLIVVAAGLLLSGALWRGAGKGPAAPAEGTPAATLAGLYTERGGGYEISAAYPTTTPNGVAAEALDLMQGWVITQIGAFKAAEGARPRTLQISYTASSSPMSAQYLFVETQTGSGAVGTSTKAFSFVRKAASP